MKNVLTKEDKVLILCCSLLPLLVVALFFLGFGAYPVLVFIVIDLGIRNGRRASLNWVWRMNQLLLCVSSCLSLFFVMFTYFHVIERGCRVALLSFFHSETFLLYLYFVLVFPIISVIYYFTYSKLR